MAPSDIINDAEGDEVFAELLTAKRDISSMFKTTRELGDFLIREQERHPDLIYPPERDTILTKEAS